LHYVKRQCDDPAVRFIVISGVIWFGGIMGCQAHVQASANVNGSAEANGESTGENAEPASQTQSDLDTPLSAPAATGELAMLGARTDLSYRGTSATCRCLAAATGQPSAFQWKGPLPNTDRTAQLVVGLSSSGIPCPGAGQDQRPASYSGYTVSGSDVVVTVEDAVPGRPIVSGAIIPKPQGGHVVLAPGDETTIYGKPLSGSGNRCVLP
jgi:hypothetical protein